MKMNMKLNKHQSVRFDVSREQNHKKKKEIKLNEIKINGMKFNKK